MRLRIYIILCKSNMATDERNFRAAYYEKVGFRSVEEKNSPFKSLEVLLKDKPLDCGKLRQYCLKFCVPITYRNLLWKILLGVVPVHINSHSFIMDQRKEEYFDLLHALNVMKVIDSNTPKSQEFLAIWLLQSNNLPYDINLADEKSFIAIVQSFMQFFDDETDVFWLAKKFYDNISKFENDFPKLRQITLNLLKTEEAALYKHFQSIDALDNLPIVSWFSCCFAGILTESALGKIWDKLCGGSCKILVYVVVALLANLKHILIKCNNLTEVVKCIKKIPEENAENIVNKSIDMWQHSSSPLTIHDKPK